MSKASRFAVRFAARFAACLLALSTSAQAAGCFDAPVDAESLARVRGGFSTADGGIAMSFSVQQSVYVNGALSASSVLQVGSGNTMPIGLTGLGAATAIVQNSLDQQNIRTVTSIDVSAQVLGAYRSLNLQTLLNGAISASLRH